MFKKTMKHLTNNPGLKILSLIIAVILWLIVVNYDNPDMTKTFTIPVTVTNDRILEEQGKVYEVVGQSNTVTIYVKGKRRYVDSLSGSDFTATADLSQIIDLNVNSDEKLVPINVSVRRYEKDLTITQKTVNMQIMLEDLSTEQFSISCNTTGTPAEGYAIGEAFVSPNLIKISGPQSIVSRISKVSANVNVEGFTEDITDNVVPTLYDENGSVIEPLQLRLSQEQVAVSVQILGTKTVPVHCEVSGTPAEGYQYIGLEYAPETVQIKGEPSLLNNIQEIRIPGEAINLDQVTEDMEVSVDITPYLGEEGISLVNPEENKIAIRVTIERLEVKNLELPIESLEVLNSPEEYEVSYGDTKVTVLVRGRKEEIASLSADQLHGSIDLANRMPGDHIVEVSITVDERFQVVGTVTLRVHIMERKEDSEEENNDGNSADSGNDGGGNGGNAGDGNSGNASGGSDENTGDGNGEGFSRDSRENVDTDDESQDGGDSRNDGNEQ